MIALATNTISIRGESYLVSELNGKTASELRKRVNSTDANMTSQTDVFIVSRCLLDPKLTPAEIDSLPSIVITKIVREALRLGRDPDEKETDEGDDSKNA